MGYLEEHEEMTEQDWKNLGKRNFPRLKKQIPFISEADFLKLSRNRQRFVIGYMLKDLKGFRLTDLYRWAVQNFEIDYHGAHCGVFKIKSDPIVKKYLDRVDWLRVEQLGFTAQRIIEEEVALSYSDITEYLDEDGLCPIQNLRNLPGPIRRAIKSFEVVVLDDGSRKYKLSLWDKGQSLHRMQKIKGMHKDNINLTGGLASLNIDTKADPKEAAQLYVQMLKGESPDGATSREADSDSDE